MAEALAIPPFLSDEDNTLWLAQDKAATRGKVRQYICGETGDLFYYDSLSWRIRKVHCRPVQYEGMVVCEGGQECPSDHPEAVPYWRVET